MQVTVELIGRLTQFYVLFVEQHLNVPPVKEALYVGSNRKITEFLLSGSVVLNNTSLSTGILT